jgi:Glycosyl transferases group 1
LTFREIFGTSFRVKRIGIFSKFEMGGGSEFRAAEMATAISKLPGYQAVLLAEREIAERVLPAIGKKVEVHNRVFSAPNLAPFYSLDHLLVINSDSRHFTTLGYWQGTTGRHSHPVDLSRIKEMTFLFNFVVSPSIQLPALQARVPDMRIITTNSKFFHEISEQSRYEPVRHYPRFQLESPINPLVAKAKTKSGRLRFGMHSLSMGYKWNQELPDLIHRVNAVYGERISWDFMGMTADVRDRIRDGNITMRPEFALPVSEFLRGIDVFVFFLGWEREEPWARSAGEALMSGCPVITTARGGNLDQILHGNTGFLCKSLDDFAASCARLIEDPDLVQAMQRNARQCARRFASASVARRFLEFIR